MTAVAAWSDSSTASRVTSRWSPRPPRLPPLWRRGRQTVQRRPRVAGWHTAVRLTRRDWGGAAAERGGQSVSDGEASLGGRSSSPTPAPSAVVTVRASAVTEGALRRRARRHGAAPRPRQTAIGPAPQLVSPPCPHPACVASNRRGGRDRHLARPAPSAGRLGRWRGPAVCREAARHRFPTRPSPAPPRIRTRRGSRYGWNLVLRRDGGIRAAPRGNRNCLLGMNKEQLHLICRADEAPPHRSSQNCRR